MNIDSIACYQLKKEMILMAFFFLANGSINNNGALVVNFDERGLGNDDVNYVLTADSQAVYACINRGGQNPRAANKQTASAAVTSIGDFSPKNGRIVETLPAAGPPSAGSFSCTSGQRLVLASVSYTNIILKDTTNDVSITIPDTSRTFVNIQ
ncbi:hypothetical protein [Bacillus arachidis]|uniref:hypothetical protein n=1 Tax=Bacillus arachidis TaxID=2819290 RepID=UPI00255CDC91|nr:hypothetical protein [Bacillus arachidis]WIY59514.1 hypothetical protein QRY57_16780 [Bacillus arachidis]